jgi:hypothetical protein
MPLCASASSQGTGVAKTRAEAAALAGALDEAAVVLLFCGEGGRG